MAQKYITQKQILDGVRGLASSQGFYSRLWANMKEDRTILPKLHTYARKQGCKDFVEFIIAIES